ncbi:MAG: hypothetical protein M5U28_40385 [Sandaracinaceae bacterium]|nr:hypothetical protein [Sandaracinaceae bacterium]
MRLASRAAAGGALVERARGARPIEDDLEPAPSSTWPAEVQSLADQVASFTTVEACLEQLRARTPTAVAEGLADLAYDGFFDDVCRALEAVKTGSVEQCDALAISTARAGCRRRLAVVHGRPSACPGDRVVPGREAVCVAWAARDPGLCRASGEEARCRAVLAGDDDACRGLRPGDRERCRAHVRRYASALGEERGESPATDAPRVMTLEVREGDAAPITIRRDVLDRGVRLVPAGVRLPGRAGQPSRRDRAAGRAAPRGGELPPRALRPAGPPGAHRARARRGGGGALRDHAGARRRDLHLGRARLRAAHLLRAAPGRRDRRHARGHPAPRRRRALGERTLRHLRARPRAALERCAAETSGSGGGGG